MNTTARKIGLYTAISVVIANMIGTGVFTSLGFQLADIQSVFAIMMLWFVGGLIALCGALSYGELASAMPRSGGEYHYLSVIFHPLLGFLSGWISVVVGFAAPVALSAMALGNYVNRVYPGIDPRILACSVVIVTTFFHSFTLKSSARFQDISTIVKIVLIFVFIIAGLVIGSHQDISIFPHDSAVKSESWKSIFSPAFAISLIFVSYAYSGWNASAYMANDIENPSVNIPKSLLIGTLVVMVLYVLLNFVFLYSAPINELKGQVEIGYVSGVHIFGNNGGNIISIMIALLLVSSVSSMVFAGPRISKVIGEDLHLFSYLSISNSNGVPVVATIVQSVISIVLIATSSFATVVIYLGFTLSIFTFLTVLGLFVMRIWRKELKPTYRTFGYPITPLIFLILSGWSIAFTLGQQTKEYHEFFKSPSFYSLVTIFVGVIFYFIGKYKK